MIFVGLLFFLVLNIFRKEKIKKHWYYLSFVAILIIAFGSFLYPKLDNIGKTIILVADFDGPGGTDEYGVTKAVKNELHIVLDQYPQVKIIPLGKSISVDDGTQLATNLGRKNDADMVIWGWYDDSGQVAPISFHLEVLCPLACDPQLSSKEKGDIQLFPEEDLQTYTLQTDISADLGYLSLFIVGMVQFSDDNCIGAIQSFTDSISQVPIDVENKDFMRIYLRRADCYFELKDWPNALNDINIAIQLVPGDPSLYERQGAAYIAEVRYPEAIESFDYAIQLDPQYALAYQQRAQVYILQNNISAAIADLRMALVYSADDDLTERINTQLKNLQSSY